jgi:hypothetical protein
VRERLRTTAVLIAQRITDEDIRVRWFRGPVGRELSRLTGPPPTDRAVTDLGDSDALAWLLIAGCTNKEIASNFGVSEDVVVRRLAEMYAKVGLTSPAEGAVFALREQEV